MFDFFRNLFSDENDRKLQRMEEARRRNLNQRLAEDGDEESVLRHFYGTGETPKKRRTGRPKKSIHKGDA